MQRKIAAFIAFNAYLLCILSAFYSALPETFRLDLFSPPSPLALRFEGPQWDHRSFSFLLLSLMATSIAAALAGAIVKNRGGVIAAQSAIPLTLWWVELFFVALFTGTLGASVITLAAIPLTVFFSAYGGKWGEWMQRAYFPDKTIFGIHPYHYTWMVFPLFVYGAMAATWLPYFAEALFQNWRGGGAETLARSLSFIYTLLPFLGLSVLLYLVYKILTGRLFKIESEWAKALISVGVLLVGPILLYRLLLVIGPFMEQISSKKL